MNLDRRAFVGGSTALLLSGCATTSSRERGDGCTPLEPLKLDQPVRAVAGLRPYRASGFVVRAEPLAGKRLVHNYGHGGAGIMGLTTARLVQEAGFPVTIYTAALPPDTTSAVAGGQVSPFGHYRDAMVTPEWRRQFAAAMEYSWRRFQLTLGPKYGVRWLPTYVHGDEPPDPSAPMAHYRRNARRLSRAEHPFDLDSMWTYETMYVETPRFMAQLASDLLSAGGKIRVRRFAGPADIAALDENLIFNCTGIGARELFGDSGLTAIRGQLAVLPPQPQVRYAFTGASGYMFPRADGILLGGTFERDEWSTVPEPAIIAGIVDSHRQVFGAFRCRA